VLVSNHPALHAPLLDGYLRMATNSSVQALNGLGNGGLGVTSVCPGDELESTALATSSPIDLDRIRRAVREILLAVGEDPDREGLRETPDRVARIMPRSSRA